MEIVKLEENFPPCLTFIKNTISCLLLNFTHVFQRLDNSCSNEYDANSGIQNKTAKGLLLSDFSQFISLKKQSFFAGKTLHKTDICMSLYQILYQHGDFLIILPIGHFHYIKVQMT